MRKTLFAIFILLVFLLYVIVPETNSHSGHSQPERKEQKAEEIAPEEETSDAGVFYAVEEEKMGSPSSLFSRKSMFSLDSMEQNRIEMETEGHDKMGYADHQVKLSHHKLIFPSQKDYKSAVGITILAGVLFGMLSVKRKKD